MPDETPVAMPDVAWIVAIDGSLLLHVPLPPIVLYNTELLPTQSEVVPVISSGTALTKTCFVV